MTATTAQLREFIIVGQCQGTGYTLWDIAPAPTDPARRSAVLEEIGVDAMDAFGDVSTECGATAREALDNFLALMRKQSGLDDYGLTADSQTHRIAEVDAVRAHGHSTKGRVDITATIKPGPDSFTITGAHPYDTGVQQRIHGGITRAGITFPAGEVAVRIDDHRGVADTLDLATACAILGAAGQIDRHALDRVVCLGELSWDGFVCKVFNIRAVVQAAYDRGHRTVLVPATQVMTVRHMGLDLEVIGARHFTQAVDALNKLAEPAEERPAAAVVAPEAAPPVTPRQTRANAEGLAMLAWVLRQDFPGATAVSVHVPDREITAVLGDGATLWDLTGPVLADGTRSSAHVYLTALLVDRDEDTLTTLGWARSERPHVLTATLPSL